MAWCVARGVRGVALTLHTLGVDRNVLPALPCPALPRTSRRSSQARREVRRGARRGPNASSDSDDGAGLDEELRACGCRLPSLNCLFTSCVLLLFIVVLNHSATLAARPRPGTPLQLPQQPGVRALPGKDSGAGADADADVDADAAGGRGSAFSWQPRARPQSPKFDLEVRLLRNRVRSWRVAGQRGRLMCCRG